MFAKKLSLNELFFARNTKEINVLSSEFEVTLVPFYLFESCAEFSTDAPSSLNNFLIYVPQIINYSFFCLVRFKNKKGFQHYHKHDEFQFSKSSNSKKIKAV